MCPSFPSIRSELAPQTEPAQPLYARYWLHNRGPAPLGGLPAVAHLHPRRVSADTSGDLSEVMLRLTAASDCTDSALDGTVEVLYPDGWSVAPVELPFTLGAGEHLETDIVLGIPAHTPAGLYPIRAQLRITDARCTRRVAAGGRGRGRRGGRDGCRRAGLPRRRPGRCRGGRRSGDAPDRHGRQPRPCRSCAGSAPDQPVGNVGVDRSGRARRCPARTRATSTSTST